ncbi:hypothetical protein FHR81_002678 [Actinoalloteichus hoggarensis]|nr:hypothetical protein [Actinoalloteichus hoggarensis]
MNSEVEAVPGLDAETVSPDPTCRETPAQRVRQPVLS